MIPIFTHEPMFSDVPTTLHRMNAYLSPHDLNRWRDFVAPLPPCSSSGPWILGGAIRRFFLDQDPADVDYFFPRQDSFSTYHPGVPHVVQSPHHTSYTIGSTPVQLVKTQFHPSMEHHLQAFDFTLCQLGWDGHSFWMTPQAYAALSFKTITLVRSIPHEFLTSSWLRVLKYVAQGFDVHPSTLNYFFTQVRTHGFPSTPQTYQGDL